MVYPKKVEGWYQDNSEAMAVLVESWKVLQRVGVLLLAVKMLQEYLTYIIILVFHNCLSLSGLWGLAFGEGRVTPWTSRQTNHLGLNPEP